MSRVLENVNPKKVFEFFEDLSQIPRGSGDEKAVSEFLVKFAKDRNIEVHQDKAMNVFMKKPATKGMENVPTVILQGHMDMVCEKRKEIEHDFTKDPLDLKIEGDFVMANGTTLGADNGIAVAMAMAILDSNDIAHGPLEVLVTTEEETGMGGATNLERGILKGEILINIDSEEEGVLLTSCAGGVRNVIELPFKKEEKPSNFKTLEVSISGLKGGHSGMEINKERGNANKLIARVLNEIKLNTNIRLHSVHGGAKMNAIPRDSSAIIAVEDVNVAIEVAQKMGEIFHDEIKTQDPDVKVSIKEIQCNEEFMDQDSTIRVISGLVLVPNGIMAMSMDIEGLVLSSTNIGVVSTLDNVVRFESATRSAKRTLKEATSKQMQVMCDVLGAKMELESDYPAWEYKTDSKIRDTFVETYKNLYNKEPHITAIHAGLECGLLSETIGDIDMISFGPNLFDVHTPDEKMSISSVQRTWDYLTAVLKNLK